MRWKFWTRIAVFLLLLSSLIQAETTRSDSLVVTNIVGGLVDELLLNLDLSRKHIAVMPFETTAGRTEARGLGEAATILVNASLVHYDDVIVIERDKLEDLIEEMKLSLSGLTQGDLEVGELLDANLLITGAVADLETRFLIAARLINVESGQVLKSASAEVPATNFMSVSAGLAVVKRYPITAAFRSLIVPGWGQFYNDKPTKGSLVLGAETVLAISTVVSYLMYKQSLNSYERAGNSELAQSSYDEVETYSKMNWGSLGALGTVWVYGIIDAYMDSRSQIKVYSQDMQKKK
ncbi:hypothetical protein HQ531_10765 [bacterium]|nr:hypothetical protein [bacterium]